MEPDIDKLIDMTLEQISEANAYRDILRIKREEITAEVVPAEVRTKLDEIELEFSGLEEQVEKTLKTLDQTLRELVLETRRKAAGHGYSMSYQDGNVTWDDEALLKLALRHPEISAEVLACRKVGKPYTRLTKTGKE